jgi:hypothetical protein
MCGCEWLRAEINNNFITPPTQRKFLNRSKENLAQLIFLRGHVIFQVLCDPLESRPSFWWQHFLFLSLAHDKDPCYKATSKVLCKEVHFGISSPYFNPREGCPRNPEIIWREYGFPSQTFTHLPIGTETNHHND